MNIFIVLDNNGSIIPFTKKPDLFKGQRLFTCDATISMIAILDWYGRGFVSTKQIIEVTE